MKKADMRRLTQKIAEDLARDYVTTDQALMATGIASDERLLTWCKERNVRHIKRKRRWLFHEQDLIDQLK